MPGGKIGNGAAVQGASGMHNSAGVSGAPTVKSRSRTVSAQARSCAASPISAPAPAARPDRQRESAKCLAANAAISLAEAAAKAGQRKARLGD